MRNSFRLVLSLAVLSSMTACSMWKAETKGYNSSGAEQLERAFWNDVKSKRWAEVDRHLASTFEGTSASGNRDKAAAVEAWKKFDLKSFSLADVQVQPNGADLVISYTFTGEGTFDGKPLPNGPIHMMTVWQQVSKGWIAIAHADSL